MQQQPPVDQQIQVEEEDDDTTEQEQAPVEQKTKRRKAPEYVQLARSHLVFSEAMNSGRLRRKLVTTQECRQVLTRESEPIVGKWYISAVTTDGIAVSVLLEKLIEKTPFLSKKEYSKKKTLEAIQKRRGIIHWAQLEHGQKEFKQLLDEKKNIYGVDPGLHNLVMGSKVAIDGTAQHKQAFRLGNKQVLKETHKKRNRKVLEREKKIHGIDKMESNLPCHSKIQEYMDASLGTMVQRVQFYSKKKFKKLKFDGFMMRQRMVQKFVNDNIEEGSVRTLDPNNNN